jgi:hypothetical protein
MVEDGDTGGKTCAPIAHDIYVAILDRERAAKRDTLAKAH